jgi:prepilin-type N-terminal cleavage/methylation domain-containing protein
MKTRLRFPAGLTMIEVVFVIAVLAILAALAVPSFSARIERQRLAGAAESLATDLAEARFEAARRGHVLYVEPQSGEANWCWAVVTQQGCDCTQTQACQLRKVQAGSFAGIRLLEAAAVRLDPLGTTETRMAAIFESRHGERLRVDLHALGRVHICSAAGPGTRYPHC